MAPLVGESCANFLCIPHPKNLSTYLIYQSALITFSYYFLKSYKPIQLYKIYTIYILYKFMCRLQMRTLEIGRHKGRCENIEF